MTRNRTRSSATRTLIASVVALVCASVAYRIATERNLQHGSLVFVGIPALLALALTAVHPKTSVGTINKTIAIALCLSGIVFGEGFICILLASPIFFLVGTGVGHMLGNTRKPVEGEGEIPPASSRWKHGIILLAPFYLEGVVPGYVVPRDEVVSVTRIVAANADAVRASLASPMKFDRPLPPFFRLGFPTPGATAGAGLAVGDHRSVQFQHGGHHPGTLVLEVTASGANAVRFAAVSDNSYITHWLAWRSAEVRFQEVAPGETRVTCTLRYSRRLDPAFYFKPLERYGVSLAAGYLAETLATPRTPDR
jgi:hypothetical protein